MYHPTLKRSSHLVATHYTARSSLVTNVVQSGWTDRVGAFLIPPLQGV
jgi:hypothetical protein